MHSSTLVRSKRAARHQPVLQVSLAPFRRYHLNDASVTQVQPDGLSEFHKERILNAYMVVYAAQGTMAAPTHPTFPTTIPGRFLLSLSSVCFSMYTLLLCSRLDWRLATPTPPPFPSPALSMDSEHGLI